VDIVDNLTHFKLVDPNTICDQAALSERDDGAVAVSERSASPLDESKAPHTSCTDVIGQAGRVH